LVDAAKLASGGVASFVGRHSCRDICCDLAVEVEAEFGVELVIDALAAEERSESQRQFA